MPLIRKMLPACGVYAVLLLLFAAGCGNGTSSETDSLAAVTAVTSELTETTSETTETTTAVTTTEETTETTVTTLETTTTTEETTFTLTPVSETHGSYPLDADAAAVLSKTVFVGDSICLGLKAYKILPADHVVAYGGIGVRNVLDTSFAVNGQSCDLRTALQTLHPENVVFSLGMNDIRMETRAQYCENYRKLLETVQEAMPDAKLYAVSITPVLSISEFTTNANIDNYNAALREFLEEYPAWGYLDVAPELKNAWNGLRYSYQSGDGLHLTPAAYAPYLYQVSAQICSGQAAVETTETTFAAWTETTAVQQTETAFTEISETQS